VVKPFDSMYSIDRAQYGFTPLPKTGLVFIEGKLLYGDYDAMLHFGDNPSRTIAFRWNGKAYQWLGEQEIIEGPREDDTPDGRFHEQVAITYYKEAVVGEPRGLMAQYFGAGPMKMAGPETNWSLTLAEENPRLKKWSSNHSALQK
jgi:hypothetical protein